MSVFTGIITAQFKQIYRDMITALLEDTALTLPCQLIFADTIFTRCPNCIYDAMSNRSSNIYLAGGPISFTHGVCPYCHGMGTLPADTTLNMNLMVIWEPKQWVGWTGVKDNTIVPYGQAQTISTLATLPDLKRCQSLLIDTNIQQYVKYLYERITEPGPLGLGSDDFIVTMWKRVG